MLFDVEMVVRIDDQIPPIEEADLLNRQYLCEKAPYRVADQLRHKGRDGNTRITHREELVDTRADLHQYPSQ